jgi:hypothetical protein
MGRIETHRNLLSEKLKRKYHSEDLDEDGRVILEGIVGRESGELWTGFIWLRTETSSGLL